MPEARGSHTRQERPEEAPALASLLGAGSRSGSAGALAQPGGQPCLPPVCRGPSPGPANLTNSPPPSRHLAGLRLAAAQKGKGAPGGGLTATPALPEALWLLLSSVSLLRGQRSPHQATGKVRSWPGLKGSAVFPLSSWPTASPTGMSGGREASGTDQC